MGKHLDYACTCGAEFETTKAMVAHYRKEHPDEGFRCYDQIETVGDDFSDLAIAEARREIHRLRTEATADSKLKKDHESLIRRYNSLARTFQMIDLAIGSFEDQWKA